MNGSSALGAAMTYHNEHSGPTSQVTSVNGKIGDVELKTLDIKNNDGKNIDELFDDIKNANISVERLGNYIFKSTFEKIPAHDDTINSYMLGACTSFVKNGRLYRNLDYLYDNTAEFKVVCKDFVGMAFINGMNDGSLSYKKVCQLPYHLNDGRNSDGIMVSSHILFNDWSYVGSGNKDKDITILPHYILTNLHKMSNITTVLSSYLSNIKIPESLVTKGYLMQFLVTDGITTYAILPPTSASGNYVLIDISANPKLTNFRWVNSKTLIRSDSTLQSRPTGIERWNEIETGAVLSDLRFTKCYESPIRLSEFIGEGGTTKDSTDAELMALYNTAHAAFLSRTRNGETWQTVHSVIYGNSGVESLYVQENYNKEYFVKYNTNLFEFTYTNGESSLEKTIMGE